MICGGVVMSTKLLVLYPPLASPAVACTALVYPPTVFQVMSMSPLFCGVTEMMCSPDELLLGSLPDRNSARLFRPSPSGSAVASACGQLVQPKCDNCHDWNALVATVAVIRPFDTSVLV